MERTTRLELASGSRSGPRSAPGALDLHGSNRGGGSEFGLPGAFRKQKTYPDGVGLNGADYEARTRFRFPERPAVRPVALDLYGSNRGGGSEFGLPGAFRQQKTHPCGVGLNGADYEARTRYLHLGKVALYQMS